MPRGGRLLVETTLETLTGGMVAGETVLEPGIHVAIRVTDHGSGMEPETLEHIFEPFFTTKAVGKGSGLGLATAYGIIRQHRGIIRASSELGRGTTFTLLLPVADERPEAAPARQPAETVRPRLHRPGSILVLEDNDSIRALVDEVLSGRGFEVLVAPTAIEAASILEEHGSEIRLLISDVILPGMSGPEFYETRVRPRFPQMEVLFISGFADHHVLRTEVSEQRQALLEKPFTPGQLLEAVERALAGSPGSGRGPGSTSPRVLFMDDEELLREVTKAMADTIGVQLETVRDGQEALAMFTGALDQQRPFDVVILDASIPGGKGAREVIEMLREAAPSIPVILTSGGDGGGLMGDYRAFGFSAALPKPFDSKQLAAAIAKALDSLDPSSPTRSAG
jgi:CheY-like chemotaxis protein